MAKVFGFGDTGEPTELEKKLEVTLVPRAKDYHRNFTDKHVKIITPLGTFRGVYRGTTQNGDAVLAPFIDIVYLKE